MLRNLVGVVALLVTVLAALNVYGDFAEVEAKARTVVDPEHKGTAFLSQVSRNPIAHTYSFVIKGQPLVQVSCRRELVLLGEYSCQQE